MKPYRFSGHIVPCAHYLSQLLYMKAKGIAKDVYGHNDWLVDGASLEAVQLVEEIVGDRPVDLIEIETVGESLQRAIQRCGVEL